MKTKLIFIILLSFVYAHDAFAQGCSDAGFCSIDGIKQNDIVTNDSLVTPSSSFDNTIKTGLSIGNTRYSVWILNSYISYSRQVNNKITAAIKLDGQYRIGSLTQVVGLSDITLSLSYKIQKSLGVIIGGKIPFSDADRKYNGNVMPMAYQTSLGTYDAIVGANYFYKNFFVALGWQQPLIQNSNTYVDGNFSVEELGSSYLETNNYKRAGDVLLRLSYNHKPQTSMKKFSFTYSLLPIYHLKNDQYTNEYNNIVEILDSNGLTLNTNIVTNYKINSKTAFELSTGFPVIARKVRPDGLSQFAVTIELIKKF
ncbi:hypothetical protein [Flavobacterium sp.]|uniref:hypothetical protein n=1 Tax=Flavobacterium sp. TaxID=239 RepID=UPI00374D11A1